MEKTEAMHEAGEYRFGFPKARNSDATGKRVTMRWNKTSLLITDLEDKSNELILNKKRTSTLKMADTVPGKHRPVSDVTSWPEAPSAE
jgi:hypothetical protein